MQILLGHPWGWKEPRTTLFAPAWLEIFPEARFLHVLRSPRAAAASIRKRELAFQAAGDAPSGKIASLDYCLELVETYARAGESLNRSPNYRAVRFEDLQAQPQTVLAQLAGFCGLTPDDAGLKEAAATIRPAGSDASS